MDKQALFTQLIEEHGNRAYNFAYRLSGNASDAAELVQEAFYRAYKHHDRYDPDRPFETWLFQILHHVYLDTVKRAERRMTTSMDRENENESSLKELLPSPEAPLLDKLATKEQDHLVQRILNLLPVPFRAAVTLCDIEGLSYEEISAIMACPIGTVRSRIHEGRRRVRHAWNTLEQEGFRVST